GRSVAVEIAAVESAPDARRAAQTRVVRRDVQEAPARITAEEQRLLRVRLAVVVEVDVVDDVAVRYREVEQAVEIEVLEQGPVPAVQPQAVFRAVVRDVEVEVAVPVDVGRNHTEALAIRIAEAGLRRRVLEGPVAAVAPEAVLHPGERVGVAVGSPAGLAVA